MKRIHIIHPGRLRCHIFENSDFTSPIILTATIPDPVEAVNSLFYLSDHLLASGFDRHKSASYLYCFDKNGTLEWKANPGKTLTTLFLRPDGKVTAYDQKHHTHTLDMRTGAIQMEPELPQFPGYEKLGKNSLITYWQNTVRIYRLFGRE